MNGRTRDLQQRFCYVWVELQQQHNRKDRLYSQGLQMNPVRNDNNEKDELTG